MTEALPKQSGRITLKDICAKPVPATFHGGFPRPSWFTEQLGDRPFAAALLEEAYNEAYRDAVSCVVAEQVALGLDIIGQGQLWFDTNVAGLGSSFLYNIKRMEGVEVHYRPNAALQASSRSGKGDAASLRAIQGVSAMVTAPLADAGLSFADHWRIAQSSVPGGDPAPVKAQFGMGPTELSGLLVDTYYGDWLALLRDVAAIYREQMEAAVAAGARIIQLDDLFMMAPPPAWDKSAEIISDMFAGLDCYRIWQLGHGGTGVPPGRTPYDRILPVLKDVAVDAFALAFAQTQFRAEDFALYAALGTDKDLGVGVISNKNFWVETPSEVEAGLRKAADHVPVERLFATTDGGLTRYPRPMARAKLGTLVEGVSAFRTNCL